MKMMLNTSNLEEAIRHVKNWKYRPPIIEQAKVRQVADRIFNEGKSSGVTLEKLKKMAALLDANALPTGPKP